MCPLWSASPLPIWRRSTEFHWRCRFLPYPPGSCSGDTPLVPKRLWRYLDFFFDCKLLFTEHAKMYGIKSFSAAMAMASLGNSNHGLRPKHKRLLYRSCILPIATYGIRLWFFKGAKYKGTLKELTRMQRRAAIWILGAFKTSPAGAVETLTGLTPIHLHIPPHEVQNLASANVISK